MEIIRTTYPLPHEVSWYKWEFVRRNAAYQADYWKFVKSFRTWFRKKGFWYDYENRLTNWSDRDENYFYAKIAPTISGLCLKWGIGNLFPPHWRFSKKTGMRMVAGRGEMLPPTAISPELNWDPDYIKGLFDWNFTGNTGAASRYGNIVRMEFDLHWPMKDIVKYAKYALGRVAHPLAFLLFSRLTRNAAG
jgi:hypothetical protein